MSSSHADLTSSITRGNVTIEEYYQTIGHSFNIVIDLPINSTIT
jgi:hypothetical protein